MTGRTSLRYHSMAIFVRNIDVSKRFYTEVLELKVKLDFGKNVILEGGITLWEVSPSHIIPERLGIESIVNSKANRFELYFETEDIERVHAKLKENNVDFLHSLHEEPWGQRTVRLCDPDKHLIEVGESLGTFLKRLHEGNMTPEQVSRKTSVPLEKVNKLLGI
ncbi:MAG: VOC family protein [Candidatus Latescibacterota bacterium]